MASSACSIGSYTVRNYLLSSPLRVCVVGPLLASLAASGCRPAGVRVAPRPDLATLDRLLGLMQQRLTLMHEVARWKWNAGQPVTDAERERELLQSVVECGRGKGVEPKLVRPLPKNRRCARRCDRPEGASQSA